MPRLSRAAIVTEKLDGTNAQVYIEDVTLEAYQQRLEADLLGRVFADNQPCPDGYVRLLRVGSRTRWLSPEDDNFGFARWAFDNACSLMGLGPGRHFGEWWGSGIQRGYGLDERRFSLFNVSRWAEDRPTCCHVVPTIYTGVFDTVAIEDALSTLRTGGSMAAPGFMHPEGIVAFHTAANMGFKKTLDDDAAPKSMVHNTGLESKV